MGISSSHRRYQNAESHSAFPVWLDWGTLSASFGGGRAGSQLSSNK